MVDWTPSFNPIFSAPGRPHAVAVPYTLTCASDRHLPSFLPSFLPPSPVRGATHLVMCHMSPTAQILGLLVTIITTIFTGWHIYCFDRGRCLLFSRKNLFRWAILQMLAVALSCVGISTAPRFRLLTTACRLERDALVGKVPRVLRRRPARRGHHDPSCPLPAGEYHS
jgi:hypothetical protein